MELVEKITEVKLDTWPRRRGLYVLFKTYYTGFDLPEWSLLELLDDTAALDVFLQTPAWQDFAKGKPYQDLCKKYPRRIVQV